MKLVAFAGDANCFCSAPQLCGDGGDGGGHGDGVMVASCDRAPSINAIMFIFESMYTKDGVFAK